jgi:hypothetical protein
MHGYRSSKNTTTTLAERDEISIFRNHITIVILTPVDVPNSKLCSLKVGFLWG